MKVGLFTVAVASLNQIASATSCGLGDEWTYCSAEYNYCTITGEEARAGYIAYGKSSQYTLIPFANKGGDDLRFYCGNNFGDVIPGTVKECCYMSADTEETASSLAGSYPTVTEGNTIYFGSLDSTANYLVEYGASGESFYRPVSNAPMLCGNTMFNDPLYGTVKSCVYALSPLTSLPSARASTWSYCGAEGGSCSGISTSASSPTWIRYGASNQWFYKQVYSTSGYVPCTNGFFEDPIYGTYKYCYSSNQWFYKQVYSTSGYVPCTNGFFEDPIYGTYKYCYLDSSSSEEVSTSTMLTRKVNGMIYSAKTFDMTQVGMVNLIATLISVITVVALAARYCVQRKEKLEYESLV
eukprot:CAMPEP_0197072660 /NCGR_PEP_ID=MMETSP1384-20130603/210207_1 /TAXON_ID=29189 /ORGANISM="Ammonia sp." /LENGTH=352 /DNA_ID=CAMNT_0042511481 /DNA_START=77 /DNA_END=1135 /DNA_ORIENTATION=+